MRLPIFQDVNGPNTAINPDNVSSVVYAGEKFTDINLAGGGVVRVSLSFEDTIARLVGAQESRPK
jgi:hypothetical protein